MDWDIQPAGVEAAGGIGSRTRLDGDSHLPAQGAFMGTSAGRGWAAGRVSVYMVWSRGLAMLNHVP